MHVAMDGNSLEKKSFFFLYPHQAPCQGRTKERHRHMGKKGIFFITLLTYSFLPAAQNQVKSSCDMIQVSLPVKRVSSFQKKDNLKPPLATNKSIIG